jgi:hypothetical protein
MTSTLSMSAPPRDEDFESRELEAHRLLRYDLTHMLDEAEQLVTQAERKIERAFTTSELQYALSDLMRAAMLAELAYDKNCENNKSEQCWRSGELINRAQDEMYRVVQAAVRLGIDQKTRAIAETAPPPKKGWFPW